MNPLRMNPLRLVIPGLLIAAISCGDAVSPQILDLDVAHQRWHEQNLHDYAFTLERHCFCSGAPLYVLVLSDTVAGVLDVHTGATVDRQLGETVEDLFTFVRTAIDAPAQLIRVKYDAAKGFPTDIDYDGSARIADDEISFRITDVHRIFTLPATGRGQ